MDLKLHLASLIGMAATLAAAGGIRPEHEQAFSSLRVGLDQAADAVDKLQEAATAAPPPDVAAFSSLRGQVETLAVTVDTTHDQVSGLVTLANGKGA